MTFTLSLPQNKKTPISSHSIGKYHFRFGYTPRVEFMSSYENGQDFLWLQVDDKRFVFVLCDGVGTSFLGDLAARFLGENLGTWISSLNLDQPENTIVDLFNKKLYSLVVDANQEIQNKKLPDSLPAMIKNALEHVRTHTGSESTFTVGMIDVQVEKAFFAWMGSSRLRIWNNNTSPVIFGTDLFNSKEKWSTKSGPLGEVHQLFLNSLDLSHLAVYSDGLFALDEYSMQGPYLSPDVLNTLLKYEGETSDDKSYLEIWFSDTSPESENRTKNPIAVVSLFESSWKQIGKSERLRISVICGWNDKASMENLSRVFVREGFNKLIDTKPLHSERNWLGEASDICRDSDVIVICLSSHFNSETQYLLVKEITELPSEYREKRIIPARLDDCSIPSELNRWHGVNLFEPDGDNRFVRGLVRLYKEFNDYAPPMAAPPPPPPPPIIGRIGIFLTIISIVFALMICSVSLLNSSSTSQPVVTPLQPIVLSPFWLDAITLLKGVFVAILFTVIPMWAAKITEYKSRVSQSITEILMFSIVLSSVAFFMFKLQGDGTWMLFAIAIAAVLDSGGHLLDYLRENQIDQIRREISSKQKSLKAKMKLSRKAIKLEKEINQYQVMQEYLLRFDQIFQRERILYVSLPVGILLGVIFGVYKDATVYEYLEYSILFVSLFATLILAYFVLKSFVDMTSPVYAGEYTPDETMPSDSADLEKFREEKESVLGFAKTTTDIRSMYLYDSAHNIFLLTGFAYIFSSSVGTVLPLKTVVLIVLFLLTFLNSFPFFIGQFRLREGILKKYAGYANAVMKSELKKDEFAPLIIKPEFFTLFNIGAGAILITLAEYFIKELYK